MHIATHQGNCDVVSAGIRFCAQCFQTFAFPSLTTIEFSPRQVCDLVGGLRSLFLGLGTVTS